MPVNKCYVTLDCHVDVQIWSALVRPSPKKFHDHVIGWVPVALIPIPIDSRIGPSPAVSGAAG